MTSLSSQLQRLAVPFASAFAVDADKKRASFLFEPNEAANIDRATFHAIGRNGIEELKQLDIGFEPFDTTLFGDESIAFERLVQSKMVNEELDRQIAAFLLRLSPHFQLKAAWKALEWLVYRYHVHQMNIDDLLMCVFPYHETNIFVRVVQMINVGPASSKWHWLKSIQKPGVTLSRSTVITHAAVDATFLAFICNAAKNAVKLYQRSDSASASLLHPMLPFYATTVAGAIARVDRPSESFVATIFPYLSKSFKSKVSDYKLSSYMIASQLALKVKLKPDIVDEMIYKMLKGFNASTDALQPLLCSIAIVFSAQNISGLKAKTWSLFLKTPSLAIGLADMQRSGVSCEELVATIASAIFRRIFASRHLLESMDCDKDQGIDDDDESKEDCQWLLTLLDELFGDSSQMVLDENLVSLLIKSLLDQFCAAYENDHHAKKALDFFKAAVGNISKSQPGAVEKVFEGAFSENADNESKLEAVRKFVNFATKVSGDAKAISHDIISDVGTSLFLALNHANAELRRLAVAKLREDAELDLEFVTDSLKKRLVDEDMSVSLEAFKTTQSKWDKLKHSDFLMPLQTLLYDKAHIYAPEIRSAAISFLLSGNKWKLLTHKESSRLFWLVAPLSILHKSQKELDEFAKNHPKSGLPFSGSHWQSSNRLGSFLPGLSGEHVSSDVIKSLSRRQLAFCGAVLATKLTELKFEAEDMATMVIVMQRLAASPATVVDSATNEDVENFQKMTIMSNLERILDPRLHVTRVDWLALFTAQLFRILFEKPALFEAVFDEETLGSGLFSSKAQKIKPFWQLVKLLLDCCYASPYCRAWHRANFGHLARSFFAFNPTLMLRFCVLADRFFDRDASQLDYQACLLSSFEAILMKTNEIDAPSSISKAIVPLIDLLVLLHTKDQLISKLVVSCLIRLDQLGFWKQFGFVALFIDHLIESKTEIGTSPQNIQDIIASFFGSALHSPKKSPSRKTAKSDEAVAEVPQVSDSKLLSVIFEQLVEADLVIEAPWYLNRTLWLLRETNHGVVLSQICPLVVRLSQIAGNICIDAELNSSVVHFYSPKAASRISEKTLDALLTALSMKSNSSLRKALFNQITPEFFAKLPNEDMQYRLVQRLTDLHLHDRVVDVKPRLHDIQMSLSLYKRLLVGFFKDLNSNVENEETSKLETSPHRHRKRRLSRGDSQPHEKYRISCLTNLVVTLECLQTATSNVEKSVESVAFLMDPIYDILDNTFAGFLADKDNYALSSEESGEETDFAFTPDHIRQLCLGSLANFFSCYNVDDLTELRFSSAISCLSGANLQTVQHTLMLFEAASKRKPDLTREFIPSIFSILCSSGFLHRDDPYSCRVLRNATAAIVPLISTELESKDEKHSLVKITAILAENWQSVSGSNGELIFTSLFKSCLDHKNIETMATSIVLLICHRIGNMLSSIEKSKEQHEELICDIEKTVHFLSCVIHEIDSSMSASDSMSLAENLCALLRDKEASRKQEQPSQISHIASLAGWNFANSDKNALRTIRLGVLMLINRLLAMLVEKSRLSPFGHDEDSTGVCQDLFQYVVYLATDDVCRMSVVSSTSANTSISVSSAYTDEVMLAFEQTNALLGDGAFVDAARNMLAEDDERKESEVTSSAASEAQWRMQQKTLHVLAERLPEIISKSENMPHSTEKLCRLLLKKLKKSSVKSTIRHSICQVLTGLARSASGLIESSSDDSPSLAVECIRSSMESSLAILKQMSGSKMTSDNLKFLALLMECASNCCVALGAWALPHLGNLVNACLAQLSPESEAFLAAQKSSGVSVPGASLAALGQLLVAFSSFTSPFTSDILSRLCHLKPIVSAWPASRTTIELNNRIDEAMNTLASIHFRLLVPMFSSIYKSLRKEKAPKDSLICFHRFVAKALTKWNRDELLPHLPKLHGFFVLAMDFRFEQSEDEKLSLDDVARIENELFDSLIVLALKLTESELRPLFFKIFDWCSRAVEENRPLRLVTFYRFSVRLAQALKSLFHLFAAPIFKQAVEVLQKTNSATVEGKTLLDNPELDLLLAASVLDMLHLLFTNDVSGFTTRSRFDAVEAPLSDQLELGSEMKSPNDYLRHIREHAAPAIVALAIAVGDDATWKIVNQSLLIKTQHNLPQVRLAALHCLELLVTKLSDDYTTALPDTVPYLAPLLEDDDETVEAACKDLTAKLDAISGESISKYM